MLKDRNSQEFSVSVIILTFNAEKYIKKCLDSVLIQTYPAIEIIAVDNNSTDGTREILQSVNYRSQIRTIFNKKNIGFAAGQNQGIRESKEKYVLCLNQDAWLDKDFVKNAVSVLENDKEIAAVQGKLLRYDFNNGKIMDMVDTKGLVMLKNRRIINHDQGKKDSGTNKEEIKEIFGADGASPVYRREALEDISLPISAGLKTNDYKQTEYFDEDFFMYKEDVDLAWRLKLAGWKAVYAPKCLAYHGRGAGDSAAKSYAEIFSERRKISGLAKYYSWKNQRLMQIKNETAMNFISHLMYILPKEVISWGYVLIFEEPYAIKSIIELLKEAPMACKKRKIIMSKKRISDTDMKKWFE